MLRCGGCWQRTPPPIAVGAALKGWSEGGLSKDGATQGNGANLGFEKEMWEAANRLRGHMDASEYKHVVLGLIFLKYISDAFEELHQKLASSEFADPEDADEYLAERVFWVPKDARWKVIRNRAKMPEIGKVIDDAMIAIERENSPLKGVLPKDYGRPDLDKTQLGELVDLVSQIGFGGQDAKAKDVLGQVYQYFLGQFAAAEGKKGGEFFTAQCVVRLLVEMIEPYGGRVYDPCCGAGGMFVQSAKFVKEHGGQIGRVSIFGQESNPTTWRLARMNLAIRGLDANLGPHHGDSFRNDLHKDLKADFILANPPFNMSAWGQEALKDDVRWKYGLPPASNANFAWMQHMVHHLSPKGVAGIVLANGSMSSQQGGEGQIRQALIEGDLVDCMVALPGQLFYTTGIPVCLWFLAKDKRDSGKRDRRGETLFIDARQMGSMIDRVHRDLTGEDVEHIAHTYHTWRGEPDAGEYEDVPGFCKGATTEEIAGHGYVLTPGRYVGAAEVEDDGEPFDAKMQRLTTTLAEQLAEGERLAEAIRENLTGLGFPMAGVS